MWALGAGAAGPSLRVALPLPHHRHPGDGRLRTGFFLHAFCISGSEGFLGYALKRQPATGYVFVTGFISLRKLVRLTYPPACSSKSVLFGRCERVSRPTHSSHLLLFPNTLPILTFITPTRLYHNAVLYLYAFVL